MLILAGVTIQGITHTGLFDKTKLAIKRSNYANAAEKVALAVNASYGNTGEIEDDKLKENINSIEGLDKKVDTVKYDLKIVVDGFEFTISKEGKITGSEDKQVATLPQNTKDTKAGTEVKSNESWNTKNARYIKTSDGTEITTLQIVSTVYAISDGNANTIPVPQGFYYVGGTKTSGVVISDNSADKNKYVGQEDVPTGVTYNSDGTVNTESSAIKGNQFVWIPCSDSDYAKINWGKSNATWEQMTNTAELAQIEKYGGFYLGRYEAGTSEIKLSTNVDFAAKNTASSWVNDNFSIRSGLNHSVTSGKVTEKAGEIPYYHADYFTAVELSKKMYSNNYVQSGLATGTMWDMAMKFVADGTNSVVTSSSWGNYKDGVVTYTKGQGRYATVDSSSGAMTSAFTVSDTSYHYGIKTTAISESVKKKNMYDLAGNLWEWTQEAAYPNNTVESYMLRGGSFRNSCSDRPACCRGYGAATYTDTNYGFRVALYIK